MSKKTKAQELQEQLTWTFPHIGKDSPEQIEKASKYCEGYKAFLNAGKTERECVKAAVKMLKKAGYRPFDRNASYEAGDKVYYVNRGLGFKSSLGESICAPFILTPSVRGFLPKVVAISAFPLLT